MGFTTIYPHCLIGYCPDFFARVVPRERGLPLVGIVCIAPSGIFGHHFFPKNFFFVSRKMFSAKFFLVRERCPNEMNEPIAPEKFHSQSGSTGNILSRLLSHQKYFAAF